jgi:hypothetical protein
MRTRPLSQPIFGQFSVSKHFDGYAGCVRPKYNMENAGEKLSFGNINLTAPADFCISAVPSQPLAKIERLRGLMRTNANGNIYIGESNI